MHGKSQRVPRYVQLTRHVACRGAHCTKSQALSTVSQKSKHAPTLKRAARALAVWLRGQRADASCPLTS
jgi:hypothetical protein